MVISSVFFILFFIYVLYSASTVHVGRNMGLFVKNIGRLSKTQVTEQRKKMRDREREREDRWNRSFWPRDTPDSSR